MNVFRLLIVLAVIGVLASPVFARALDAEVFPEPVVNTDIVPLFSRIADADGATLTAESDLSLAVHLLPSLEGTPVTTPNGRPVTLGEFTDIAGRATVECTGEGTRADLELSGLIPGGVYTLWLFTFEEPGFDGTPDHRLGGGAYGPYDRDQNAFVASESGEAEISVLARAGTLSAIPAEITGCLLSDTYEFHIVGTYHIDGLTYGAMPGPVGTEAFQFGFIFVQD